MPISLGIGTAVTMGGGLYGPPPQLDLNFASLLSLTPSVGPTPSFTRASTGTYFDASGVLTTAAINGPRFDHVYNGVSWVSKGLLIEEARTNSVLESNGTSAGWASSAATTATNALLSPDGTVSASEINVSAGLYPGKYFGATGMSSAFYSYSIYAKKGTKNWFFVMSNGDPTRVAFFNLNTGALGSIVGTNFSSSISDAGGGWYRCVVTDTTATGAGTVYHQFGVPESDGSTVGSTSGNVYIYGAQLEAGSFPTSYIPTTTTQLTRSADVCQITGGDFTSFWNEPAGTLVAEGDTPASGTRSLVSANNTTANESSVLRTVGTDPLFVVTDGGVAQASIDAGTVSAETAFKLAAAYTVNDFAVSKDGAAVVTDTSGTIPTPTQITIGTDAAGNYVCGHIARLRYFNTRLINSQLVALST